MAKRKQPAAMVDGLWIGPPGEPDRYRLGPAIGSGSEGVLYRGAFNIDGVDVPVAIKMLSPGHASHLEDWHARWAEQVRLLASMAVPGLVGVRDGFVGPMPHRHGSADTDTAGLYLVMDWVEGEPLDRWLRRQPAGIAPEALLAMLIPVAAALDVLHTGGATGGRPLVHRDVKPANILVTDTGTVLVDIGSLRSLDGPVRLSGVAGTPGYIAPEARVDGLYGPAADRYALGGVAFFLLTGDEPPPAASTASLRALLDVAPTTAGRPEVIDHVLEALAADPHDRPGNLANWVAQLRRSSLVALPGPLSPPLAPRRLPPIPTGRRTWALRARVRRRRRWIVAAAALGMLVGIAGALDEHRPYDATATLRVGPMNASGSVAFDAGFRALQYAEYASTHAGLQAVARRLGGAAQISALRPHVQVTADEKTRRLFARATFDRANTARDTVNALAAELVAYSEFLPPSSASADDRLRTLSIAVRRRPSHLVAGAAWGLGTAGLVALWAAALIGARRPRLLTPVASLRLRARRRWVVIGVAVGACIGAAAAVLPHRPYRATAVIRVGPSKAPPEVLAESVRSTEAFARLAMTDSVLTSVDPNASLPQLFSADEIRRAVSVRTNRSQRLLSITASEEDPAVAARLANIVSEAVVAVAGDGGLFATSEARAAAANGDPTPTVNRAHVTQMIANAETPSQRAGIPWARVPAGGAVGCLTALTAALTLRRRPGRPLRQL